MPIQRTCHICQQTFYSRRGRNKAQSCEPCYTEYRSLYNLIQAAKYRAKQKKLEFDLDIQWAIAQPKVCPKTGMALTYTNNGSNFEDRKPSTASIDKIDPAGGYTRDNCQIVCWWYNVSKLNFKEEDVIHLCRAVVNTFDMKSVQGA